MNSLRSRIHALLMCFLACLLLMTAAFPAFGDVIEVKRVTGDLTKQGSEGTGGMGTEAFYGFSQETDMGANVTNVAGTVDNASPPNFTPFQLNMNGVKIKTKAKPDGYGPTVWIAGRAKPTAPNMDAAFSYSRVPDPNDPNQAFLYGGGSYTPATKRVGAGGFSQNGAKGEAAGSAEDPFSVSPGTYRDYQYSAHVAITLDQASFGGLTYFALDSRYTAVNTFYERGQPFDEALWSLSISATGPLGSASDLDVAFSYNPAALTLLHSDGVTRYTNEEIAATIEGFLGRNISDGSLDTTFDLFPSSTNTLLPGSTAYSVTSSDGDPITYAFGLNAGLTSPIPEPSTFALLGIGILGLLGYGWRRKQPAGEAAA